MEHLIFRDSTLKQEFAFTNKSERENTFPMYSDIFWYISPYHPYRSINRKKNKMIFFGVRSRSWIFKTTKHSWLLLEKNSISEWQQPHAQIHQHIQIDKCRYNDTWIKNCWIFFFKEEHFKVLMATQKDVGLMNFA